jgi:hypothetical protein
MGHQISKYPLTPAQIKEHKLPPPPELVPVLFKECGHRARLFSPGHSDPDESLLRQWKATHQIPELPEKCWACRKK